LIDQNRANVNAPSAHDPAVGTNQLAAIIPDHHRFRDVIVFRIFAIASGFLTNFQRRKKLNPRIPVSYFGEGSLEPCELGFILFDWPTAH
jgi:hypothetical protein